MSLKMMMIGNLFCIFQDIDYFRSDEAMGKSIHAWSLYRILCAHFPSSLTLCNNMLSVGLIMGLI